MPPKKIKSTLTYPEHRFNPENLLNFVETREFQDSWDSLELSDEDPLFALEMAIMADPKAGDVIKGTGGVRKLRFVPSGLNKGKRGAFRVCYVFFEDYGLVLLLLIYPKSECDNLSPREKQGLKQYISLAKKELESNGPFRFKTQEE